MRQRNFESAGCTRKVIKEVKGMMMEITEPRTAEMLTKHVMLLDNTWAPILANQIYEYGKTGKPPNHGRSRVMKEMFGTALKIMNN